MNGTNEPGGAVAASFTLTRAEHLHAFDRLHPLLWWHLVPWITAPGGRPTLRARLWVGGALLVVVGGPLLFARGNPKLALVGPLLVASGFAWLWLVRALRRRVAAATYVRTPALQQEQRWTVDAEGVAIDYDGRRTRLAWRELARVEETEEGFGFVVSLERTGFLPRRALADGGRERVRALLRAGLGDGAQVRGD